MAEDEDWDWLDEDHKNRPLRNIPEEIPNPLLLQIIESDNNATLANHKVIYSHLTEKSTETRVC